MLFKQFYQRIYSEKNKNGRNFRKNKKLKKNKKAFLKSH